MKGSLSNEVINCIYMSGNDTSKFEDIRTEKERFVQVKIMKQVRNALKRINDCIYERK